MASDSIQKAYAGKSDDEWDRLESTPFTRIEYLITTFCLERYLPDTGFILDAGSGPGRYAIDLASKGYRLAMFDIVHEMLRYGQMKAEEKNISGRFFTPVQGNISILPYSSQTFDAVISLGAPISHLLDAQERLRAVFEMMRVLKPGGRLFLTGLTRISLYRAMAYWMNPVLIEQCVNGDPQQTGIFRGWIMGYAFEPRELRGLLEQAGLQIVDEVGCESIGAHLPAENLVRLEMDHQTWECWRQILLNSCNEPSIVGISNHLLVVGEK